MKNLCIIIAVIFVVLSCASGAEPVQEEAWTVQHERHFQKNCKEKLLTEGVDGTAADDFCDCCLKTLKTTYETGGEAIEKVTDEQMQTIEEGCRQ